ncbi:kinase-like domain-containing protein [Rhizophagus irregularis DAOM 181602=DAOM 197198]|uniref:Sel1 repeat family protein n=1 Tax=Rhizophagus irregularis (strain DAOM 181602 / DAOM 197198 / MUCL 43194) TaxID=747089 RepID=A0A2P4PK79_RHIID|nr:hypothetical protein GLOIN_2v1781369 [Rhizophagus irregularis DAOM 181602=DAOM 197198]POG65799.1 hypothetical protein GLOIN_2v1781369 [Rhizophagus irregularis DAOM 181602=DAOM 197198]GBC46763.2 kinase-like domain-containing protein [Rhizophagus irregularis DAOM 181602=DAOM 197198]|eukprot:XP_025172665.1 hypothetical protein GLOIN_2v1781369 [Rhizophagus irregularis DAOM 181602=DAOM 197198]
MEIYNSLRCRRNSVIDPYSIDKNVLTNRGLWLSSQAQQAHIKGIGTKVEKKKAFELLKKHQILGHKLTESNLATLYKKGKGTKQCYDKATELYNKGYSNMFGWIILILIMMKKVKLKKRLLEEKSTSLINTFINGIKEDKISFHEFITRRLILPKYLKIIKLVKELKKFIL